MKKYWFKKNKFGIGWVPSSLEGWFVVLGYLGLLAGTIWETYRPDKPQMQMIKEELPTWVFLTLLLLGIAYFKREKLSLRQQK